MHELDAAGALAGVEEGFVLRAFAATDAAGVCLDGAGVGGEGVAAGGRGGVEGIVVHDVGL